MINEPIELETVPYDKTMYPAVKVRFGAFLLDLLVIAPFGILVVYLNSLSTDMYYFTIIPSFGFSAWYHIYLLKRYGGTPGKLISGIRVVKTNGKYPGWKEAFLRNTLLLTILIFGIIIGFVALSKADAGDYKSLDWRHQREYLKTLSPGLFTINLWLSNILLWSDLIGMLSNRKKIALHDLIAGTVVVRDRYIKKLRLNQPALANKPVPVCAYDLSQKQQK
jgi:uncharacterized RDD family membrane protein YckC